MLFRSEATIQFLLKNLYWKDTEDGKQKANPEDSEKTLAWRFNLDAIEKNIDAVGEAMPADAVFEKPVLFLRGERSGYVTAEDDRVIRKHFPQATIKTIAGAGHWIHAEKPGEFLEEVVEFLKK